MRKGAESSEILIHGPTVILHGSYKEENFPIIEDIRTLFEQNGFRVTAPKGKVIGYENGFAILEGEENKDTHQTELEYIRNVRFAGPGGFSYFVNSINSGELGKSALAELAIAQTAGIPCFFLKTPKGIPFYLPENIVWSPENLIDYFKSNNRLPGPHIKRQDNLVRQLWLDLAKTNTAIGMVLNWQPLRGRSRVLVVETDQWKDSHGKSRWSIPGQRVKFNETTEQTIKTGLLEELGINSVESIQQICVFDQIPNSGYHLPGAQLLFVDQLIQVRGKQLRLNSEAKRALWAPISEILSSVDLEPNARVTLEILKQHSQHK